MTDNDLVALGKDIAREMREFIDPFLVRLKSIEDRILVVQDGIDGAPGPQGPAGERGEKGEQGEAGPQGPAGDKGLDGASGLDGKDGAPGPRGETGARGEPGEKGLDGIAGRDGLPGVQGPAGEKGIDGKDGRDGIDGLGFDDIQVDHDGERSFTFRFVRGDQHKTFGAFTVPAVIYRGVFSEGQTYAKGDSVTWGGHMWIALDQTALKPDEHGAAAKAWQLSVKRGREGKSGKDGAQGRQGLKGERGDQGPPRS